MHDQGYAEVTRGPTVGRRAETGGLGTRRRPLLQAGKPVEPALVNVTPLRPRLGDFCSVEDQLYVKTDEGGRFVFDRVRPGKSVLWVHSWKKAPVASCEFVPLDLTSANASCATFRGRRRGPRTCVDQRRQ